MHVRAFQTGEQAVSMGFANVDSMVRAALRHTNGSCCVEETYTAWRESELAAGLAQLAQGWSQKYPGNDDIWLSEKALGDLAGLTGSQENRSVIGILRSLPLSGFSVEGEEELVAHDAGPRYQIHTRESGGRLQVARVLPNRDWFAILLEEFMAGAAV